MESKVKFNLIGHRNKLYTILHITQVLSNRLVPHKMASVIYHYGDLPRFPLIAHKYSGSALYIPRKAWYAKTQRIFPLHGEKVMLIKQHNSGVEVS